MVYGYSPLDVMRFRVSWYWKLLNRIPKTNAERILHQATAILMLFDDKTRQVVQEQLQEMPLMMDAESKTVEDENQDLMIFLRSQVDGRHKGTRT